MSRINLEVLGPRPEDGVSVALIATRLSDAILSGALASGAKICQQAVADHFNVSRMPVREALRQVQAKGLIEYRSHRSLIVAEHKPDDAVSRIAQLESQLRRTLRTLALIEAQRANPNSWMALLTQQSTEIEELISSIH
ncbi:GntR family transcriptional regulator [Pseudomonas cichorii]|nr:GntR family transcriptional regulator [Pseudomonas cichorii]MBX8493174.1 GntR family transcriptional regulator [Pseudomonas cichorii]